MELIDCDHCDEKKKEKGENFLVSSCMFAFCIGNDLWWTKRNKSHLLLPVTDTQSNSMNTHSQVIVVWHSRVKAQHQNKFCLVAALIASEEHLRHLDTCCLKFGECTIKCIA